MSDITTTTPKPKQGRTQLLLFVGAATIVGLTVGTVLGGAIVPPAEAITKVETVEVTDEVCQAVAEELFDQLSVMTNDVVTPSLEAGQTTVEQFLIMVEDGEFAVDWDVLTSATESLGEISDTLDGLTERTTTLGPDYRDCVDSK